MENLFSILLVKTFAFRRNRFSLLLNRVMMTLGRRVRGYRKGSHTAYNIQYHFVWVTKYRCHVLEREVKLRVREVIRQICQQHDLLIEQGT